MVLACLACLAIGSAGASTTKRAVFGVKLTATLTKTWTATETVEGYCDQVTTSSGRWQLSLATSRPNRLVAIAPTGSARSIRFSPAVIQSIAGEAAQTAAATTEIRGPRCVRSVQRRDCGRQRRSISGARARLSSTAGGRAGLGRLSGASSARTFSGCSEPSEVRSIRPDLNLAGAPISTADVFGRAVPGFFIRGDTEQVTTIEGSVEGRVTERVRWTLRFTRLSG
ncbi:MAG: hypothetical protein H0V79_10720 [Actinobacteria bacterium]|nr:hypothetical protein [Actinomycetota bacterium]